MSRNAHFSSQKHFVWCWTNGMWFSIVCTRIDNYICHPSGQDLLWTHSNALHESTTSLPLWIGGCHFWQKYIPDLRKNRQFMTACGHYWRNYSKEGNCWSVYWCPWKLHMQPSEVRERQVAYNQRGLCKNLLRNEKKELIWNCAQSEKWPVYIICTYLSLCKRRKNFRLSITIITFAKYPH